MMMSNIGSISSCQFCFVEIYIELCVFTVTLLKDVNTWIKAMMATTGSFFYTASTCKNSLSMNFIGNDRINFEILLC